MPKIGIMQGRVIPEDLNKFQIFPVSHWQAELIAISKMGVEYVELLYDKRLVCKELFASRKDFDALGIRPNSSGSLPNPRSICIDYLASVCALKNWEVFYNEIIYIAEKVKSSNVKILVIPFCDENLISTAQELEGFFELCQRYNLDELAGSHSVQLALEFGLPATTLWAALKKNSFSNIRLCYDLGNSKAMGYCPEEEIAILGDFICHVHIKDRCVGGPNVMLGEGEVDFSACFKALKENGYKGTMVLETKYSEKPALEASKNLQFIIDIIMDNRL
ncbi:sugar phosphate isomerase/epimerase [Candidatus Pacearchaeota archaeon]|nr:sugar phosphate isomerase/epimerase [Candidatus Pacearchaeota archaeon]